MDIKNETHIPSEEFLQIVSGYFDYAGINQPFKKVYITSKNNTDYATILFIFVIAHLPKIFLPQNVGTYSPAK